MIEKFVKVWDDRNDELRLRFSKERPDSYGGIVKAVIEMLESGLEGLWSGDKPDSDRIHVIDDGDYQGTLVFVIGGSGYQPSSYWSFLCGYGSCSGCDTFQAIEEYGDEISEDEVKGYMTLALHVIQGLKPMHIEYF